MSLCDKICEPLCQEAGARFLEGVFKNTLQYLLIATYGAVVGGAYYIQISNAFDSFTCNLPINLTQRLTLLVSQISTETSTVVKDVLIYATLIIFLTMLLLTMFTYLTIYIFTPGAIIGFFIGSFFIIVIAVVALYFGVLSIYDKSASNIELLITDIENLLLQVECAAKNGLCCSIPGCTCVGCPT